jgi:flavodoxin
MKGLVVYDSVYGNTKMIAEAIAEQISAEGHEAVVQSGFRCIIGW